MSDRITDHERGAYTPPTEGPLAFEARQPVRGARPFPVTLVVSVLVLLALAAAIFVFYKQGVRQSAGPPQAVGTPVGGLKAPASADAQPQDAAAGLEIYRSEGGQPPQMVPAQPQFTPPPEQPAQRPQAGPPMVIAAAPAAPAPTATTLPPAQAPGPALRPSQNAPSPLQPAAQAPAKAPAIAVAPPPKPAAPAAKTTATVTPPAKPAAEKPKTVAAKPVAETAEKAAPAKPGAAAVQIGAVSSPSLADKTWNDAVAISPGLAAGKGKGVEKVDKDGKTLYRTSVTGFASKADAQAFCAKLKAAGKACFVK
jgi:hypothetical protein